MLVICMVLTLVPTMVFAEENTASVPSVWAYATKEQLTDDTFSPNLSGVPENIGKLTFGQKSGAPLEWYLLGKGEGTDDAILFAATPIGSNTVFSRSTGDIASGEKEYQTSWECTYASTSPPTAVYPNHYGGSDLRSSL